MSQTSRTDSVTPMPLIPEEQSKSRLGLEKAPGTLGSPTAMEGLIPNSAKELNYLRALWEEAQRYHEPGLPYRNIYIGAVGLILAGWVFSWVDQSFSTKLGGILMLAGGSIGAFYSLKSLRQQRLAGQRG